MKIEFELTEEAAQAAEIVKARLDEQEGENVDLSAQAKNVFLEQYVLPQHQQIVLESANGD